MNENFKSLNTEEYQKLKSAITWITVLIAGADGHIDQQEKEWAEKLANIRSYSVPPLLSGYYQDVGADFQASLEAQIEALPEDTEKRNYQLSQYLSELNPIMAKLDVELGAQLYDSFKSFARHVAKASGGFLRFFSVSSEEKDLLDLDMIYPIVHEAE